MSNVTASYGMPLDFIAFFGDFYVLLHVWNVITSSNFYKLCVRAEVYGWKFVSYFV